MSDENKAVEILQQIRRQYDWSIGDLITAITKHKRNKAIAKQFAIYKRTAYSKIFEEENWSMTGKEEEEFIKKYGIRMLGPHIRRELQTLEKTPCFGKYSYSKETDSLSAIRNGAQVLDDHAPLLVSILKHIPHEYRPSGKYTSDILTDSRHVIIAAILGNLYHPNSFEAIQLGLGLYLYQGGTRTRTLDTLSNMGICRGSTAISTKYQQMVAYGKAEVRAIGQQNSAIVAYDNFDYAVGRRGERVGEKREFCSITTALITEGRFVPKEGLTQAMWNPFTLLTSSTFLRYLKADNMFNDTRMYCIHASIMRTMAFSQNHDLMNVVQCSSYDSLPAFKSEWHPLAPIHISESTNENNMTILEDIYINQMGKAKDDPWFQKGLFLCAGDLKTVERMLSVKTLGRETASRPYDRYAWLLPIPGLWHLKLNFLFMLSHVHKHSGAPVDDTSLQYAIDKWDRSGLMAKENFKDLEELIIHSYDARILGLLMQQIRKLGLDFDWKDKTKVKEWISSQSSTTWKQTIVNIHQRLHPRPQDFKIHDEKWNNERRFCNHVEAYLLLDHAIHIADIGLLRRALGECAVLFQAKSGRKPKYARELLRMVHMIDTDASSPSLQKAVLAGCLDNLRGLQNSHLAKDLLLELHNGFLKQNKSTRQSSTKDIPAFLDQTSLNSALMQQNRSSVEALTKTRLYSSKHPMKITTDDIFALARDLSNKTLVERSVIDPNRIEYRNTLHASPDLYIEGFGSLEANITAYNKQIIEGFDLEAIDSREKVIYDGDDLPLLAD